MSSTPIDTPGIGSTPQTAVTSRLRQPLMGVRVDALLEIAAALAAVVAIDALWGSGNRFLHISPHPFWAVVILAASYYGTREGLAAAVLAYGVLLASPAVPAPIATAPLPGQLGLTLQAVGWGVTALALGEIRGAWRRRAEAMRAELDELRNHNQAITLAYERLNRERQHLESRVASQLLTVHAMYNASRAIDKPRVGDVLMGLGELVRTVLAPAKFSLFLLNGSRLEAAICEGWESNDTYSRSLDESSPLYRAVVFDRRHLAVVSTADEPILRGEGVLAGPVSESDTGDIVGMLKVESIGFLDLHPSSLQNFRIVCEWIGSALANAQRVENLRSSLAGSSSGRLHSAEELVADREVFQSLANWVGLPGHAVQLAIDSNGLSGPSSAAQQVQFVLAAARSVLAPHQRCYESSEGKSSYVLLLPGSSAAAAESVAERFAGRLHSEFGGDRSSASVRFQVEPL